jgi:peptide/nickel transport system ATP-binding protein
VTGLSIRRLTVSIGRGDQEKPILRGIDLEAPAGRITGLAGESGSGKTMTGLAALGLLPSGSQVGGQILFEDRNLLDLRGGALNDLRGSRIAMVFQDPTASLHPMLSIEAQLTDHLRKHRGLSKRTAVAHAIDMLELVKVPDPARALKKYPHQFSGGQLQRIAIAMAVICGPSVLVADEPTTALDVTVQAGILRLLRSLCDELDLAVLLVTHDLGVMSAIADTIAVMRNGEIVEHGERFQVITDPQNDYTRGLIDALPRTDREGR